MLFYGLIYKNGVELKANGVNIIFSIFEWTSIFVIMKKSIGVTKEYSNSDITVLWKPAMCIHSKLCWKGLQAVFDPKKRPWINMQGATTEAIMAQVKKCPSGALSLKEMPGRTIGQTENVVVTVLKNGPLMVKGRLVITDDEGNEEVREKNTAFCRCGASENKPFCDGTHRNIAFIG